VRLVDVSDAEAEAMTLADNASALQGRDDASLAVEMATRSFERGAPLMADMGYGADDLDRMVRAAGDAVLRDAAPPSEGTPAGDAATEWEGMPDYENPSDLHRKIIVSFTSADNVASFFSAIGQTDTGSTKSIWYPPKERRDLEGLRWQDGE